MNRLPTGTDLREIPVGVLAYIGDAVYELAARMHAAGGMKSPSGAMHARAVALVRARAQAEAARAVLPTLSEDEQAVYHRARNHVVTSSPRNADPVEYRMATGFEAVVGYLYLQNKDQRLDELIQAAFAACATGPATKTGAREDGKSD